MGDVIRKLVILLGIKADAGDAPKVGAALEGIQRKAKAAQTVLIGVGAAVSAALGAAVVNTAQQVQEITRWSDALGVPAERMQALGIAFGEVGLEMEDAADLMYTAAERLVDARIDGPASDAAQMAKRLGIALKDANGNIRSHEEILFDVADALQRVETDAERTAIANTFFGDVGVKALGLLQRGGESLRGEMERIQATGAVMSTEEVETVREATAQFNRLMQSVKGLALRGLMPIFTALNNFVLPRITQTVEAISRWLKQGDRLERINKALATGFRLLGVALASFAIFKAVSGFVALGRAIITAVAAFRALGAAATAANLKVMLIPAAIAGLLLLLEDISVWLKGGDSLIGRFVDKWKDAPGAIGDVARALDAAKPALQGFFSTASAGFGELFGEVSEGFRFFSEDGAESMQALWTAVKTIGGLIAGVVFGVVKTIVKVIVGLNKFTFKIFRPIIPTVARIVGKLAALVTRVVGVVSRIATKIAGIVGFFLDKFGEKISWALGIAVNVIEAVLPVVIRVIEGVIVWVERIVNLVAALIDFFASRVPGWFDSIGQKIRNGLIAIGAWVMQKVTAFKDAIKAIVIGLAGEFGVPAENVISFFNRLEQVAVDVLKTISEWVDKIIGKIGEAIGWAKDLAEDTVGLIDDAGSALDDATSFLLGDDSGGGGGPGSGGFLATATSAGIGRARTSGAGIGNFMRDVSREYNVSQEIIIQGNGDPDTVAAAARQGAQGGVDAVERRAATRDLATGTGG